MWWRSSAAEAHEDAPNSGLDRGRPPCEKGSGSFAFVRPLPLQNGRLKRQDVRREEPERSDERLLAQQETSTLGRQVVRTDADTPPLSGGEEVSTQVLARENVTRSVAVDRL